MIISVNLKKFSPVVVRVGVALIFLWFGIQQLIFPAGWTFFLPDYVLNILPFQPETLVLFNGFFEILFGTFLILGFYTRPVALILALHMAHIVITVGYSSIGVRDFGLFIATLSVFLNGSDFFSADAFFSKRYESQV